MELRVFDKTVQPLGAIDELASLLWHTKYFDVGTFSLLAPITDNNSRLLVEGNLITKHDGKKEVKTADGGVWRRAAQITYVHITKDENGLEQLEAQGYGTSLSVKSADRQKHRRAAMKKQSGIFLQARA